MLVAIPIGLWIFSLGCDLAPSFGASGDEWAVVARYTMAGGIAGALLAAVPGLIDMLSLPWPIKRTALVHMGLNLTVVALFAVNLWLRLHGSTLIWLSVLAVGLLAVSGWLGGKMVYRHGVAVEKET